jgi:hypothetical protein
VTSKREFMAFLPLAIFLFSRADAAEPATLQEEPSLAETSVVLNLYDLGRNEVLQSAVDALAPLIHANDVFVLVSGNHKGAPDVAAVARWAENLHQRFPDNAIWVLSSGLANVKALADARAKIPVCVSTIVYDYEPKWDNEPEFDADFAKTIANFAQAVKLAHGGGFALAGAPTGRPLLKAEFARYGWDYGKLAQAAGADGMLAQTQTYCKRGLDDFRAAIAKLKAQQTGAGLPLDRIYPQVTVDPKAVNGAAIPQAVACIGEARSAGFGRVTLWFAPSRVEAAVDFLKGLGRQNPAREGDSKK